MQYVPNTPAGSPRAIGILTAVLVLLLVLLRFPPAAPIIVYSAVFISSSLLYLLLAANSLRCRGSEPLFRIILLSFLLVRLLFLNADPIGSDDVYRYMWDGRVQASGMNPYAYAPSNEALAKIRTEQLPRLVNHPEMKSIYFPLTQWFFYLGYLLSGEHVWGYKILIFLAEVISLALLLAWLKRKGLPPWPVLLYAANPLVVTQFSLDAHVDALGFPFLIASFLFYVRKKVLPSMVFLGCSLLVKPIGLIFLPFLLLNEQGLFRRMTIILVPLAVFIIPFLPYFPTSNPFDALVAFSAHWHFNGALFSLLHPLFDDNQLTRLVCLAALASGLLGLMGGKIPFERKVVLGLLVLFLCSPVVHPWYVGWLVVLLPIVPLRSGIIFAATASLASVTFVSYQLGGVWADFPAVLVLEYVPVLLFFVRDLRVSPDAGNNAAV